MRQICSVLVLVLDGPVCLLPNATAEVGLRKLPDRVEWEEWGDAKPRL